MTNGRYSPLLGQDPAGLSELFKEDLVTACFSKLLAFDFLAPFDSGLAVQNVPAPVGYMDQGIAVPHQLQVAL